MRIGIGVTSYNRPECLEKWKQQIAKHTSMYNVLIYIAVDSDIDRRGVAFRKNECLRALQECDHVFLFDDDCWPIRHGWEWQYINSDFQHLLFLSETHDPEFKCGGGVKHGECGGVMMYMTKKCIDHVGAFDEQYNMWGFEHADYSRRICNAGLIYWPYVHLDGSDEYLHSEDYSNPSHKSSISNEDKAKYFAENFQKFRNKTKQIYLPL